MIRVEVRAFPSFVELSRPDAVAARRAYSVMLLCQRLSVLLGSSICPEQIARSTQGKPYLPEFPQLAFNVSHTAAHWVLVSSVHQQDLGVDVESLDRKVCFDGLAQHAFHPHEYRLWLQEDSSTALWFRIWTVKEAILKAHGIGIALSLNTLNTQIHPVYSSGQMQHLQLGYFAYHSFEQAGLMLSVAWRTGQGRGEFVLPRFDVVMVD